MFGIGVQELLVVLVIVLLIYGARNLPLIGTNMGRAIANFKKGLDEDKVIEIKPEPQSQETKNAKS